MKSTLWWVLFIVVVFGVGWTSSSLSHRVGGDEADVVSRERNGRSRVRMPPVSIADLKDELGLTEEQLEELNRLKEEALTQIQEFEESIHQVMARVRRESEALLTETQKKALEDYHGQRWERWKQRKVERHREWFGQHTKLEAQAIANAVAIVKEYEDKVHDLFKSSALENESSASRDEMRARLREIVAERDDILATLLSADELERFQNAGLDRRRRGGSDRGRRRGAGHLNKDPLDKDQESRPTSRDHE